MKKLYKFLIIFFVIIEFLAIILYVTKEINLKLFLLFTLLSTGMIIWQNFHQVSSKK